ncbi:MAG: response regulator [Bdellovibrionales bacterium]|nr:response regulator [Bdellovibrionales bacterium]
MKILVLEDCVGIRLGLELVLEWEGHQVISFERGDSALRFLSRTEVDFILMDWNTPGVCGQEFLDQLDQTCLPLFRPSVGVLSGDERGRLAVESYGAQFFFLKPFSPENIVKKLRLCA